MRNDRKAQSAFHAEVINKNTGQQFVSDYYPINFIASDNYVFFNTLYNKSGTGINLASKAATWLYGPMRNPTRNFRGNINTKYSEALHFLESAANVEYARETAFLDKYATNNPELKTLINDCMEAGADKYINLITALNLVLKGRNRFEAELDKEIERIEKRRNIMDLDQKAAKEGRYVAVKKGSNKQKLTSEEYAKRHELNGDPTMGDTVLNPYYNFNGKKIFDSMFKNDSDFSIIAENIMLKYGSQLLNTKNGIMHLNKQQAIAMIKILIQEAYNTLVIEFSDIMKKVQGENRSSRRERIEEKLNKMTSSGGHLDQFFKDFANSPDPATALTSIAEQYHIPINTEEIKTLGHSTKTLNTRIKKIYDAEKAAGKTKLSYRAWRKEKNLTEKDMREFVYMMANVKAQAYYTNEGMALADIVKKGGFGATGGGVNAPTDVNGGFLICTFSYDEYPEAIQQKARELISGADSELSTAQARALQRQQKVTDKDSYVANINSLQELQTEQLEILKRLKNSLKSLGIDAQDMITHINIHETIKGYASIDATTDKFKGASFGTTLIDQVGIINEMLCNANISKLDAEWLIFAMINCGEGMIGSSNKHALEDYLSGYVGLLMFSDASFIAQDIYDYMNNMLADDILNIHLYVLNDKYVPSSYILHETYVAMDAFLNQIEIETNGTTITLTTYSSPNAYATWTPESEETGKPWTKAGLAGPAWTAEGKTALENTHLTMYFISNFLGLLQQLQQQLQSI